MSEYEYNRERYSATKTWPCPGPRCENSAPDGRMCKKCHRQAHGDLEGWDEAERGLSVPADLDTVLANKQHLASKIYSAKTFGRADVLASDVINERMALEEDVRDLRIIVERLKEQREEDFRSVIKIQNKLRKLISLLTEAGFEVDEEDLSIVFMFGTIKLWMRHTGEEQDNG